VTLHDPNRPPDAQDLYAAMRESVRALLAPQTHLVGITSGGAWLAARLHADLGLAGECARISSVLHRDDFGQRGLAGKGQTHLPFAMDGADVLLIDDVLYTGRTIRAILNELYDFGRPARVRLAVLADRGGRELPIQADYAATHLALPASQSLALTQDEDGRFRFSLEARR